MNFRRAAAMTCASALLGWLALAHSPASAQTSKSAESGLVTKAPAPRPIDYDKLTQEATDLLSRYIKINTTNPPGNELAAANMLKEVFLANGIAATVWQSRPGRGIVGARLRGKGRHTKALILLSHIDVVPADPKGWDVPPFSGQVKNGVIWGRGALDDKGPGVIELMAMLAIKRAGILLDRDVLFLATADEEEGGKNGAGWIVEHEADVFNDAGYVLNEGGAIVARPNGKKMYAVSITEKTPLWLKLTAQGPPGHAAVPPAETAVTRLIHALGRVVAYRSPIRIIDQVRDYFRAIAKIDGGPPELLNLRTALRRPDFVKDFLAVPRQNAMVRDTFTPTVLSASMKTNVIPAAAYAEIDGRLLPGDDPQQAVSTINKVIGDDGVKVEVTLNFPSASSPRKSQMMTALEDLAKSDQAEVVPTMIDGFTDSHYFRQKGLSAYGFIPIELTPADQLTVHGLNEKITVKQLGAGIRRMVALLELMGEN
jgi:acetylornithine deacetylase/succinyl-diaminopimelate desuccinylase-like protein